MSYAEVIGDPIAQSKSPAIHKYWLEQIGIAADYRAVHVRPDELASYLDTRRADPKWRGCNITIPHKQEVVNLLDDVTPEACRVGAVNCVVPQAGRLVGYNTDVDGIAAALEHVAIEGTDVVLIGAGGAARGMCTYLAKRFPNWVMVIARDPAKAAELIPGFNVNMAACGFGGAAGTLAGAELIVNASPLGMRGSEPMSDEFLQAVEENATGATLFDMVYDPLETPFLRAGAAGGAETVDGLTMLIGQARRAFALFFGQEAPQGDDELRAILTADQAIPA